MLHGHERAITQIKYNREGDLIFSAAKDPQPNVWYSLNGERLGTFVGHNGAVWCIDSSCILFQLNILDYFFHIFPSIRAKEHMVLCIKSGLGLGGRPLTYK